MENFKAVITRRRFPPRHKKDRLVAGVLTSPNLEVENESARKLEVVLCTLKKTRAHIVSFQTK